MAVMEELDDVNVPQDMLWTQAILFACDVTNTSVTASKVEEKSPYELWLGKTPIPNHLRPFGAVGYARRSVREHEMALRGDECVFMGIPRNFLNDTVSLLLVKTGKIVERQDVQWITRPDKTGSMGVGDEDLGVKPIENKSVVIGEAPQMDGQKLKPEEQLASQEREQEMQEVLSDPAEETQEVLSDPEEEAREAPSDPEKEIKRN